MKWPWKRERPPSLDSDVVEGVDAEVRLAHAELRARQISAHTDRLIPRLHARLERNHWTETAQEIAKGRHA